jgi:hypothetical protein
MIVPFDNIGLVTLLLGQSQRPRGLKHELSSLARTLGSWVRIPLKARMFMCVYSVFVLSCAQVVTLTRADPLPKGSYLLYIGLRNWKSGQGPTKDCTAIDRYVGVLINPWLFLFPIFLFQHNQKKEFFLDGLKKLEQRSHKWVELRGEYVE